MTKKKVAEKNIIAEKAPKYHKTHDLRYSTRTIANVFRKMSKEKKVILDEMGFGALSHIPSLNMTYKLLKELTNSFNLYENTLITRHEKNHYNPCKDKGCLGLKCNR
ncbi:hypothetical protein AHAS_Ahas09G0063100 [Arachis hypogaea]